MKAKLSDEASVWTALQRQLTTAFREPDLTLYGEAMEAPSPAAYERARQILDGCRRAAVAPVEVALTGIGGFSLRFSEGPCYAIIECENDGTAALLWKHPERGLENWEIGSGGRSLEDTLELLRDHPAR